MGLAAFPHFEGECGLKLKTGKRLRNILKFGVEGGILGVQVGCQVTHGLVGDKAVAVEEFLVNSCSYRSCKSSEYTVLVCFNNRIRNGHPTNSYWQSPEYSQDNVNPMLRYSY